QSRHEILGRRGNRGRYAVDRAPAATASAAASADRDGGVQLLHFILNLLARFRSGPAHQQGIGHRRRSVAAGERALITKTKRERRLDAVAPRGFWQEGHMKSGSERGTLDSFFQTGRRRIERLA